jgi:hypothetical protein
LSTAQLCIEQWKGRLFPCQAIKIFPSHFISEHIMAEVIPIGDSKVTGIWEEIPNLARSFTSVYS